MKRHENDKLNDGLKVENDVGDSGSVQLQTKTQTEISSLDADAQIDGNEKAATFKCEKCGRMFRSRRGLLVNFEISVGKSTLIRFRFFYKFKQAHETKRHGEAGSFECAICDKVFTKKNLLEVSGRVAIDLFEAISSFDNIQQRHTADAACRGKNIHCHICPKRFFKPQYLKVNGSAK